jgi:hypothetical protein
MIRRLARAGIIKAIPKVNNGVGINIPAYLVDSSHPNL